MSQVAMSTEAAAPPVVECVALSTLEPSEVARIADPDVPPDDANPRLWRRVEGISLTDRELEVLALVSQGLPNVEIGRRLYLSEDTVKSHLRRAFRKLKVADRTQAVAVLYEAGVLGVRGRWPSAPSAPSVPPEPPRVTVHNRVLIGPAVTRGQLEVLAARAVKRAVGELDEAQQRMFRERAMENLAADFRAAGLLVEGPPP